MLVYKALTLTEAEEYDLAGVAPLSPDDRRDGYVHLSTQAQLAQTLQRHFSEEQAVRVLAAKADDLGDALRWEASRNGEAFPHLYGQLQARDVVAGWMIGRGHDGSFRLPAEMAA